MLAGIGDYVYPTGTDANFTSGLPPGVEFGDSQLPPRFHTSIESQVERCVSAPRRMLPGLRVQQVAVGQGNVMVLAEGGEVFAWGAGKEGENGVGRPVSAYQPRMIFKDKSIRPAPAQSDSDIAAASPPAPAHTHAHRLQFQRRSDGKRAAAAASVAHCLPGLPCRCRSHVVAGRYHCAALTSFGAMYTWGGGESGQLGHGVERNGVVPKLVRALARVVVGHVSFGEHHSAIITSGQGLGLSEPINTWLALEQRAYTWKQEISRQLTMGMGRRELLSVMRRVHARKDLRLDEVRDTRPPSSLCPPTRSLCARLSSTLPRLSVIDFTARSARMLNASTRGTLKAPQLSCGSSHSASSWRKLWSPLP